MSIFNKIAGYGSMNVDKKILDRIEPYMISDESVLQAFTFVRDSIVLTNKGLYFIDVQGLTGKKVEVKFFPGKNIKSISFETAGNFDLDVDIKISVDGNTKVLPNNVVYNEPISFKVPKSQSTDAQEIIKLIKEHFMNN